MNIKRRVRRLFRPRSSEKAPNSTGKRRSGSGAPPPPLKDGWTTGPPDYIGIGVQKAGTTRWWKLIVKHPDVVGWQLKETHQLSRFGWRLHAFRCLLIRVMASSISEGALNPIVTASTQSKFMTNLIRLWHVLRRSGLLLLCPKAVYRAIGG